MARKTSVYRCRSWKQSCWRICTTHQSMARAEAAAALQPLSRGKSTPIGGIPGHCSASGACPHSSGFGILRSLPFSTHLVLLSLVLSHCLEWLEMNPTPGQCGALLGLWGSRCQPRDSSTPRCHPGVTAGCSSRRAPAHSPRTGPRLPPPSAALSLQVCSQLEVCPKQTPEPRPGTGMLVGDRGCPRHSGFEDKQSPCSPWLPPVLTWKEKLLYAAEELLIHPPRLCSGPCLCIPA